MTKEDNPSGYNPELEEQRNQLLGELYIAQNEGNKAEETRIKAEIEALLASPEWKAHNEAGLRKSGLIE